MPDTNTPMKSIGVIQETVKYYLEKRFDSFKLQMAKQSSQITSALITTMTLMSLGLVLYVFVMLTIGLLLGQYWESYPLGFAAVSVIVAATIFAIYFFKESLITQPVIDQMLSQVDFEHVNSKEDFEAEQRKLDLMQKMAEDIIINEVNAMPNHLMEQFLNKNVLGSQAATMAAYAIQTASNHFVAQQANKANLDEWWKPFIPVLIDFAKDYLENFIANLKVDSSSSTASHSQNMSNSNLTTTAQAIIREPMEPQRPDTRPSESLQEVEA